MPSLIGYTDPARQGFTRQLSQEIASRADGVSQLTILSIYSSDVTAGSGSGSGFCIMVSILFPRLRHGSDLV